MDPRLDQFLGLLNHHRVALGGLAAAMTLGSMAGGYLKPNGLLEEPKAAQLISSTVRAAAAPEVVIVEPFPASTANRPWVAGTDALEADEPVPLIAAYDDAAHAAPVEADLPDSTPSVADYAVDAIDEAPAAIPPAA